MITLGIDTASSYLSVALLREDVVLSCSELKREDSHSVHLMGMIESVLNKSQIKKSEIDLISVNVGPGSFTSLRIGVATARGLSQFGPYPIVSVSSLEVLKENGFLIDFLSSYLKNGQLKSIPFSYYMIPMIDGRKKKVYASIYKDGKAIETNLDIEPSVLISKIKDNLDLISFVVLLGTGALVYESFWKSELKDKLILLPSYHHDSHGVQVALLGRKKFLQDGEEGYNKVIPNYIRLSDAELVIRG